MLGSPNSACEQWNICGARALTSYYLELVNVWELGFGRRTHTVQWNFLLSKFFQISKSNTESPRPIQISFLRKIQNRTNRKTVKKTVLLYAIWILNLEVVVFPSKFKILNLGVVVFPSKFKILNLGVVVFPSKFKMLNLEVVVFPFNLWNLTTIWQLFCIKVLILNFSKECHYIKNKVRVVNTPTLFSR